MKRIKWNRVLLLLPFFSLLGSCDPPFPPFYECKSHLEYLAENKTSKAFILEYEDVAYHYSELSWNEANGCIQQTPYETFLSSINGEFIVRFLIDGESEMKVYLIRKETRGSEGECDKRYTDNGCEDWETRLYNLDDTTSYSFGSETGYLELPFSNVSWEYNPENDTNYTYCSVTFDSILLDSMRKDYRMLEKFADYYSQQR